MSREILHRLMEGRLPNINELSRKLQEIVEDNNITFKYVPQARKEVFNNELFNKQLTAIFFDIETMHEELESQYGTALRKLNYAELYYSTHSNELSALEAALRAVLFTFANADFYFLNAYDDFSDMSKLDRKASTNGVIDLGESVVALPFGAKSTQKINSGHLYGKKTWPVVITRPFSAEVTAKTHREATTFGEVFSDVTNGWLYDLVSTNGEGATIQFTFPLAGEHAEEIEVLVSRIELITLSANPQTAKVEYSTDNVNFETPQGYEEGVFMRDQSVVYGLDFDTDLIQFVRITLSKETPDKDLSGDGNPQFLYTFGLKNFSAYTTGRKQTARYQSKAFDFSEDNEKLGKVSISTELETPKGTSVDFSVALAGAGGAPESGFIPIKPINADAKHGANEIVKFGSNRTKKLRMTAETGTFVNYITFRGHSYFKIDPNVHNILPQPIFTTAQLFRGINNWYRDTGLSIKNLQVTDNYISFEGSNLESLYATIQEVPIARQETTAGRTNTTLIVDKPVYFDSSRGHSLKPTSAQQSATKIASPNFAVYRVQHRSHQPKGRISPKLIAKTITLSITNFVTLGKDALTITPNGSQKTLTQDADYVIVFDDKSKKPTGQIRFTDSGILDNGLTVGPASSTTTSILDIDYVIDPDITHKVSGITGNKITLGTFGFSRGDSFEVTYRFVPVAPNDIIKASIRIKTGPTSAKAPTFFVEGTDYTLDPSTGVIQRLPNGAITRQTEVYADFLYKDADASIETFLIWCEIANGQGISIPLDLASGSKTNTLVVDTTVGEKLLINSSSGLIDVSNATKTPLLGPGWVQFIVRSKNPDANINATGTGNLIDQVIQLRDVKKQRIFKSGGEYFRNMTAFRNPMTQRTLSHLKTNVLVTDHTVFALDETNFVNGSGDIVLILNFNPNTTPELYLKKPSVESSSSVFPIASKEEFELQWEYKVNTGTAGTAVIVRCDLTRDNNIDGAITPKVFNYFIRAGR